ncbi:MAG: transglycosylase SLT domain-containing protein [Candidatus Pacearchaeota archaeon]
MVKINKNFVNRILSKFMLLLFFITLLPISYSFVFFELGTLYFNQYGQGDRFSSYSSSSFMYSNPQTFFAASNFPQSNILGSSSYESFSCYSNYSSADFIISVPIGGCYPQVIRSDLLAEQNVVVFCKLSAILLNPTIDIERLKRVSFVRSDNTSDMIGGQYFYIPPKMALSSYNNFGKEGFPSIDNLGYFVFFVKRQPDERKLPDNLSLQLTATLTYDAPYAFGLGVNEKKLIMMSDEDWRLRYREFGFFNGKGFLRLDKLENGQAKFSVYSDERTIVDSFYVKKGEESSERYLPGFYCNAAYKVNYLSSSITDKQAIIVIDGNENALYEGEEFENGLCKVNKIESRGIGVGEVTIVCGGKSYTLAIKNIGVFLEVNGNTNLFRVGDKINSYIENGIEKEIYLGYHGINDQGISFFVLIEANSSDGFDSVRDKAIDFGNRYTQNSNIEIPSGFILKVGESLKLDKAGLVVSYKRREDIFDKNYNQYNPDFERYFSEAIREYETLSSLYGQMEFYDSSYPNYEVASFKESIELSKDKKQKTAIEIARKLREKYPSLANEYEIFLSKFDFSESSVYFDVDGINHFVFLKAIKEPEAGKNLIILNVEGRDIAITQTKAYIKGSNQQTIPKDRRETNIYVDSFNEERVFFKGDCVGKDGGSATPINEEIGEGEKKEICGINVMVKNIQVTVSANVRLIPVSKRQDSKVNFTVHIGIEKRAFPLNPDRALDRIKRLNKSIEDWEKISDNVEKIVKPMKAACFATSAVLQVKNLFSNLGGKAIARQEVMQGSNGWNEMCDRAMANNGMPPKELESFMVPGPYMSLDDCYSKNSARIEEEVNTYFNLIKQIDTRIREMEASNNLIRSGPLGKSVDTTKSIEKNIEYLRDTYKSSRLEVTNPLNEEDRINISDIIASFPEGVSYSDMRDIELNLRAIESGNSRMKKAANDRLFNLLKGIKELQVQQTLRDQALRAMPNLGIEGSNSGVINFISDNRNAKSCFYTGRVGGIRSGAFNGKPIEIVSFNNQNYIVVLENVGGENYRVSEVYDMNQNKINRNNDGSDAFSKISSLCSNFVKFDSSSYNNFYQNAEVRYYETEPYKGMPAVVPIDLRRGWYAATKQTIPAFGQIKAFSDSGAVSSFWLCNVGKNGREEFNVGYGDDICQMFNLNTGQPLDVFPGLTESEVKALVSNAISALEQAAAQYSPGVTSIIIRGVGRVKVGNPAASIPGTRCQDFMSPGDCRLLFNVCDPVICPPSRCNLGGKYYVENVVQSGIVGSLFLCLPNIREGIAIPICLTGVQAGLDNFISILKASRDCLQENLNSGQYTGICDEITAIYKCEFFWKQAAPFSRIIIPKMLEFISGKSVRGGGEYMSVQSAWKNMENSFNYFKNFYAVNSINAFRLRSTQEAKATSFCKVFTSLALKRKFELLIEPDSPSQFSAWFDEISINDAALPPISHYKVYYHIYAGEDSGVYYSVYLKESPGMSFFAPTGILPVATGFVSKGEYVDEAKDFQGVSGYKQLCVRINNQERCGFKQVSTSFAINYLRDKYMQKQITDTNIASDKDCISGNPSIYSLLNPNIQSGAEELINPSVYERGIIRVCSSENPGSTTEPSRWKKVGHCDDVKIGCWLDMYSIDRAIGSENKWIKNKTVEQIEQLASNIVNIEKGKKILISSEDYNKFREIDSLIKGYNRDSVDGDLRIIDAKLFAIENDYVLSEQQKAKLRYYRAKAYAQAANVEWQIISEKTSEKKKEIEIGSSNISRDTSNYGESNQPDVNNPPYESTNNNITYVNNNLREVNLSKLISLINSIRDISIDGRKCSCGDKCSEYANYILSNSEKNSLDPILVLSLIMQESNCRPKLSSDTSHGIMQINEIHCGKYNLSNDKSACIYELKEDVNKNIEVGTRILKENYDLYKSGRSFNGCSNRNIFYQEWEAALRAYNGWGCNPKYPAQDYFVEEVISRKEKLREMYDKIS